MAAAVSAAAMAIMARPPALLVATALLGHAVGSTDAFSRPAGIITAPPVGPPAVRQHFNVLSRQHNARFVIPVVPSPPRCPVAALSTSGDGDDAGREAGQQQGAVAIPATSTCWNPSLRKVMGSISTAGMVETAYLTYAKLFTSGGVSALCGAESSSGSGCSSVLDGPYAAIHLGGTEVPLSALGFVAYGAATGLALFPLLSKGTSEGGAVEVDVDESELDGSNRIALLAVSTAMATFSSFLMSILFGVLHASCPFCIASAMLSLSLGVLSWSSDMIPPSSKTFGTQTGMYSFGLSTVAALVLFFNVDGAALNSYAGNNDMLAADGMTSSLVASTAKVQQQQDLPPPPITKKSSDRAIALAVDLEALDSRMFGAYWCSHCYEQKQTLGFEAMRRIPYVECAKEGLNSQRDLCNERKVPGYPTWEIGGKLYPGEQELDELEAVVKEVLARRGAAQK